jgi:iron complex outermembrane receptor protein
LNYQLAKGTFLRCSYGQGYRYPTLAEKYLSSQLSSLSIFSNPDLLPESSWNTELGIKQGFKIGNFMGFLDAAGFWQQYQNTIEITYGAWQKTQISYLPPGNYYYTTGFKYLNTGPTRVKGLDFSIAGEGDISKNVKIDVIGGWTYTMPQAMEPNQVYATDTTGEKLSYAKTSSNISNDILKYRFQNIGKLDVELKYKRFSIGGNWTYYSNMQNIDTVFYQLATLASYGIAQYRDEHHTGVNVFNARVGMQATKKLKMSFVVNNLFNLSYSLRPLKIESPRTFAIRLSYKVG